MASPSSTEKPVEQSPRARAPRSKRTATSPKTRAKAKKSSTATRSPKTATQSQTKPETPTKGPNGGELLSLSKLAEHFDLDRAVVRRRLNEKEIQPIVNEEKKKLYELTPELEEAVEGNTRRAELDAVEQELDIQLKKTKLEKEHGRLVEFDKAADVFTKVTKGLFDRFIQYATKAGPRLHKCRNGREVGLALRRDFEKIFGELRVDYRSFMK